MENNLEETAVVEPAVKKVSAKKAVKKPITISESNSVALCEENLFRGGLQNFLTRSTKLPLLSIIIVSLVFSAVHFSWYGFLSRFFLGFILGFIYHYSGKIWLNIIAHFLNNALAITALYIYKMQGKPLDKALTENGGTWWGILALPVIIGFLLFFKRISYGSAVLSQRSNN